VAPVALKERGWSEEPTEGEDKKKKIKHFIKFSEQLLGHDVN
jgi:hypothetical protein